MSPRHAAARAALALLTVGALACRGGKDHAPADAASVRVPAENIAVVKRTDLQTGPRLSGTLQARRRAEMRAELQGSVVSVKADLGDRVRTGDVLATIEASELVEAEASARANLQATEDAAEVARREVERTRALVKGGASPKRDLDTRESEASAAAARVDAARAQLAAASTQLQRATIRAPLDGVVSVRAVDAGDVVAPGTALYTIIDPSTVRLEASVVSESLTSLRAGLPVDFQIRGYPGRVFTGKVTRVSPSADPVTRTVDVIIDIPNPGGLLLAGLFAEGRIVAQSHEALVAPLVAVDSTGDVATVTRVRQNVVERVPVSVGLRDEVGERIEVTSGVSAGDVLLVRGAEDLTPGTVVELAVGRDRDGDGDGGLP